MKKLHDVAKNAGQRGLVINQYYRVTVLETGEEQAFLYQENAELWMEEVCHTYGRQMTFRTILVTEREATLAQPIYEE